MTRKPPQEKRPRGKPGGTRQKEGLYSNILVKLHEDKLQKGQGYTAFALSGYLGEPYPTVQQYLADLGKLGFVRSLKVVNMTLFSITKKGIESLPKTTSKD